MHRFYGHIIGVDQGQQVLFSDFEHDGDMWTGKGPREVRKSVSFSESYRAPPVVHVGMSMWDTDHKTNMRADIQAENITAEGFELVFKTWADSRVARVRASWMAIGQVSHDDEWQLY